MARIYVCATGCPKCGNFYAITEYDKSDRSVEYFPAYEKCAKCGVRRKRLN